MCPVCSKKVGAWHKDGIHPACRSKVIADVAQRTVATVSGKARPMEYSAAIGRMSQSQRDAILRGVNRAAKS